MGTSKSSEGPGSGVPMVPPWVPEPAVEEPEADQPEINSDAEPAAVEYPESPIAPAARFRASRRALGEFAQTEDRGYLRRALAHYVRTGYGGAAVAARRMAGTANTAGALYNALTNVAAGRPAAVGSPFDPALLHGHSVREIMDAVVEAVRPIDGTQDAEAARPAIREALSELLTRFPDAHILNLDAEQRIFVIECYAALDVFRRIELDLGKSLQEKAPSAATALSRLKEIRDYVKEVVAASFRRLRNGEHAVTAANIRKITQDAVRETFQVFESYYG